MKQKILLVLALCICGTIALAQVQYNDTCYAVSFRASYGHNLIYGSHANFDLGAHLPINPYFEMDADMRASTANFYTLGLQLRPKFALPVGELFLEDRLLANLIVRDQVNEFNHAISLGYRMQHVSVQFGLFTRVMVPMPYERNSNNAIIVEPFKLLYRVEAFVRPQTSRWNIAAAISNVDDYMMERPWTPMLYLRGWFDVNQHWRLHLAGKYKNAGTFHMNAHYYASEVALGAEYRF